MKIQAWKMLFEIQISVKTSNIYKMCTKICPKFLSNMLPPASRYLVRNDQQNRQCTYNITLWCIIVVVGKQ